MASTLLTIDQVRDLTGIALSDDSLELLIDAADADIQQATGPHQPGNMLDMQKRRRALVQLVQLDSEFNGVQADSIDGISIQRLTGLEYNTQRDRIFAALGLGDGFLSPGITEAARRNTPLIPSARIGLFLGNEYE